MVNFRLFSKKMVSYLATRGLLDFVPDRVYIPFRYWQFTGEKLNLKNPTAFCEKLQWLKLYDHQSRYTIMVDKIEAKKYVANLIGEEHIVPTLSIWNKAEEIDIASLPQQFVLKCNHNSGTVILCPNKQKIDLDQIKRKLRAGLKKSGYSSTREWPYKDVKRKIFAEEYLTDSNIQNDGNGIIDYKFYCFNGEPKFLYVGYANMYDGKKHDQMTFFNFDWSPTEFYRKDHEQLSFEVKKPQQFDEMLRIARVLSDNISFCRVDLFVVNERIYFSELTFWL